MDSVVSVAKDYAVNSVMYMPGIWSAGFKFVAPLSETSVDGPKGNWVPSAYATVPRLGMKRERGAAEFRQCRG